MNVKSCKQKLIVGITCSAIAAATIIVIIFFTARVNEDNIHYVKRVWGDGVLDYYSSNGNLPESLEELSGVKTRRGDKNGDTVAYFKVSDHKFFILFKRGDNYDHTSLANNNCLLWTKSDGWQVASVAQSHSSPTGYMIQAIEPYKP